MIDEAICPNCNTPMDYVEIKRERASLHCYECEQCKKHYSPQWLSGFWAGYKHKQADVSNDVQHLLRVAKVDCKQHNWVKLDSVLTKIGKIFQKEVC